MSPKVLVRIALALGAALLMWGALALAQRTRKDSTGGLSLPRLTAKDVMQIAFRKAGDTLVLSHQDTGWTVNGFPATPAMVETFLGAIGDSSMLSEVVAQSRASHARLGVDSPAGRRLTITVAGKPALDLWFGNRGPDFEGFYVRPEGSDIAYLLRGRFAEQTVQSVPEWREKQITRVAPDSVAKVEVVRGKTRWSLTRSGTGWALPHWPADSTKVARFLGLIGGLRAAGFPDSSQLGSIHFTPPARSLTAFANGGGTLMALVFDSTKDGSYWVRQASGGAVYKLDSKLAELATPAESTLKK
jgi:hypothetical protein